MTQNDKKELGEIARSIKALFAEEEELETTVNFIGEWLPLLGYLASYS